MHWGLRVFFDVGRIFSLRIRSSAVVSLKRTLLFVILQSVSDHVLEPVLCLNDTEKRFVINLFKIVQNKLIKEDDSGARHENRNKGT